MKLAIPSHSELLQWEKIGKVANWAKLAILSESESLQWEKIRKVANWANWLFPEPKSHIDLKSNFFISGGGEGGHHPELKCHVDLKSNFFISGVGGGDIAQNQNVMLTWNPTKIPFELENQRFSFHSM